MYIVIIEQLASGVDANDQNLVQTGTMLYCVTQALDRNRLFRSSTV